MNISTKLSYNLCKGRHNVNRDLILRYYVKRKYPVNPAEAEKLPVFQYASAHPPMRVYVWGMAEHGALGVKPQLQKKKSKKLQHTFVKRPVRTYFAEQHKIIDIACGYGFTAMAANTKEKYKVFGMGINTDSQIGFHDPRRGCPLEFLTAPAPIDLPFSDSVNTSVKRVAAGRAHLLVLTDAEGVFTLGNNSYGQCGRQIVEQEKYEGSQIIHNIPSLEGSVITSIECGQDHSMLVTEKGEVYACGWGSDGQTALGHFDCEWRPSKVKGDIQGENIIKISSTSDTVLALNDKGEVFGWGNSEYGQIPQDSEVQQQNTAIYLSKCKHIGKIIDVAAGGSFCIVVNEDGDVFVWGYGILGKGPKVQHCKEPSQIPSVLFGRNEFQPDTRVIAVSAGLSHLAAITNYGDLYMWGQNRHACLGLGHENDQYFPLKVAVGAMVQKVCCGVDHTVALCKPFF